MKRIFIIVPLAAIAIAALLSAYLTAKDIGKCPYEGAECPNVQQYKRDYQFEYHYDTLWIYDADRLVSRLVDTTGEVSYGHKIDSVILADNY